VLFNSQVFIFFYLPIALGGFFLIGRYHQRAAAMWMAFASLVFYSWWDASYTVLLLVSIVFNYLMGKRLARRSAGTSATTHKAILIVAIVTNLGALAYFKYFNFFITTVSDLTHWQLFAGQIILPLGISFFTFTQIAFLVDTYRNEVKEYNFVHYVLFVTYFPHLIAGPVIHHKEMMPQFGNKEIYRFSANNFLTGLSIFTFGLIKKAIADNVSAYSNPVFDAAKRQVPLTFAEAWLGAISYTLQIYFDFSGYSDMAIGLAQMTGLKLPLNFNSPYKAVSIIDFWRRWHITLSRFLRDYLYIPLGGNRLGLLRRHLNLIITMLLGGLWHGAGWTFVIWGALHGLYLMINHAWVYLKKTILPSEKPSPWWQRALCRFLTFLAVVLAWVFFRADSLNSGLAIVQTMLDFNSVHFSLILVKQSGLLIPHGIRMDSAFTNDLAEWGPALIILPVLLLCVWFAPNVQEIMARARPAIDSPPPDQVRIPSYLKWRPSVLWALITAFCLAYAILSLNQETQFIYFNF
jgi:alginate O-acetyltransferase complex protein AlgI